MSTRVAASRGAGRRAPAWLALVAALAVGAPGACGGSSPTQQDASVAEAGTVDAGPEDGPRPHPDVAPVPGFTITVDGVPWYILNGSISLAPTQDLVYVNAMISCDACADIAQLLISLASPPVDRCGPSDDTLTFTRSSLYAQPFRTATGDSCGFQVSAAGDTSPRATGSFHGQVRNINSSITTAVTIDAVFDLVIGTHFP